MSARKEKLATYASPAEVKRLKRMRERVGISQTLVGAALCNTPLRTYQSWEDPQGQDAPGHLAGRHGSA